MSIDKFGRTTHEANKKFRLDLLHQKQQIAYTADGDFDLQDRRLCNVKDPKNPQDCATKQYSDITLEEKIGKRNKELAESIEKTSIIPLEAKITKLETTNKEESKKLVSLDKKLDEVHSFISRQEPTTENHMATKKYVDDALLIIKYSLRSEIRDSTNKMRSDLLSVIEGKFEK